MIHPLYSIAGLMVGMLVGMTGGRWRVAHDAAVGVAVQLPSGDCGRHRPALRVGDEDGRGRPCMAGAARSTGASYGGSLSGASRPRSSPCWYWRGSANNRRKPGETISVVLGVTLVLTSIATLFRARLLAWLTPRFGTSEGRRQAVMTVVLGAVLGVLVSLTSVGAGAARYGPRSWCSIPPNPSTGWSDPISRMRCR